jgi:hypothetical protein
MCGMRFCEKISWTKSNTEDLGRKIKLIRLGLGECDIDNRGKDRNGAASAIAAFGNLRKTEIQ